MNWNEFSSIPPMALFALLLWSLAWRGFALWASVKNSQRNWYIALLILNTLGILEIVYLFFFAKKRWTIQTLKFWGK